MGSCCGKEESDTYQDEEVNERTRLLADPARRSTSDPVTAESSEHHVKPGSPPQRNDEHKLLSDILDQTVRNIIDVSQMDNTVSEQHDYQERAKKYTDGLYTNSMSHPGEQQQPRMLSMKDVSNVERMLGAPVLAHAEYADLVRGSAECYSAVQHIVVQPREDLLVPFAIAV